MDRSFSKTSAKKVKPRKIRPQFEELELRIVPSSDHLGVGSYIPPPGGQFVPPPGSVEVDAYPAVSCPIEATGSTGTQSTTTARTTSGLPMPALTTLPVA